jgi:putative ABC transport system permease protein
MNLSANIRFALSSITSHKLRSFLTMIGIIIGVASIITLVSIGRGVELLVDEEFQGLGNNLLFILPETVEPTVGQRRAGGLGLTIDDYEILSDPFTVPAVVGAAPIYGRPALVIYGRNETKARIQGTVPEYVAVRDFYPVSGDFINAQQVSSMARVAVIGQSVYETLFSEGQVPIGEKIRINNIDFTVIGVMEEKGSSGVYNLDDQVFVPITTAQRRLFPARRSDGKLQVDVIFAGAADPERLDLAINQITSALRQSHHIRFRDEDDFSILSRDELAGAFAQITEILTIFLGIIAGISLLVGGIGIMNMMLVTVTERTREIGLRKAVGAKQRDIMWQLLTEAVLMTLVGGFIGLLLGILGTRLVTNFAENLRPVVDWTAVALGIIVSTAVGLFFGMYPAMRAARMNPIEALRYE